MYQERGMLPNGNPFIPFNDDAGEQQQNMQLDNMNLLNNSDGVTNSAGMMGSIVQTREPGTAIAGSSGGDATAADEELKKKIALYYHQLVRLNINLMQYSSKEVSLSGLSFSSKRTIPSSQRSNMLT